jgi:hypothetical protein
MELLLRGMKARQKVLPYKGIIRGFGRKVNFPAVSNIKPSAAGQFFAAASYHSPSILCCT